jgi:hypothetical protein
MALEQDLAVFSKKLLKAQPSERFHVQKNQVLEQARITKIWAHFRRSAPETGLYGVPLRSIPSAMRRERSTPLQSLARSVVIIS